MSDTVFAQHLPYGKEWFSKGGFDVQWSTLGKSKKAAGHGLRPTRFWATCGATSPKSKTKKVAKYQPTNPPPTHHNVNFGPFDA